MKYKYVVAGITMALASISIAQDSLFGPSEDVISARELGLTQEEMREMVGPRIENPNRIDPLEVDRVALKFLMTDLQTNLTSVLNKVNLDNGEVNSIVNILEVLAQENRERVGNAINTMCTVYNSGADITTTLNAYDIAMAARRADLHDSSIQKLSAIRDVIDSTKLLDFNEYYESRRQLLEHASSTSFSQNIFSFTGNNPIPTLEHHCAQ